jgi:hypothetical protein
MLTVALLLALAAFVVTIWAAMNKAPLWPAVLLIDVAILIQSLPLR